jgi:hypothetical protein
MAGPLGQPSLAELRPMGRAKPGSDGLSGAATDYDDDYTVTTTISAPTP